MEQATIIGIDLAKRAFQLHGAAADGSVAFRKKLPRERVLLFLAAQPRLWSPWRLAAARITGVARSQRSATR